MAGVATTHPDVTIRCYVPTTASSGGAEAAQVVKGVGGLNQGRFVPYLGSAMGCRLDHGLVLCKAEAMYRIVQSALTVCGVWEQDAI